MADPLAPGDIARRRRPRWMLRGAAVLATLAAVGAGDLSEVDFVPDKAQHKAGEMVLGH